MVDLALLQQLAIALLIGLVIGLEREIAQENRQNVKFAGLRTFGIVGLMGGISAYMAAQYDLVFVAALLAITALTCVAYYKATDISKHLGYTTEMALLATFLLGGLTYYDYTIAVILAIVVTVLLAFKDPLHEFTYRLPKEEFYDTLKFALIALVILPILPNQAYGPLSVINPYQLWLYVVIISGISFVGYFLVKWFGADLGLSLTGLVGGLASSTAVTTNMATRTREEPAIIFPAMAATTLANTVMVLRVLFLISLFDTSLLAYVYLPMGMMFVAGILVAAYFYIKGRDGGKNGTIHLKTPFSIVPALMFTAFIGIVLFISKAALVYVGSYGLYLTAAIAGLADTNAITISTSQLAAGGLANPHIAVLAIMLAVFVNLAIHGLYGLYFGTKKYCMYVTAMASAFIIVGVVVMAVTFI